MRPAVLIVDDSLTVRMDLLAAFEAAGLPATACGTIAEAIRAMATTAFGAVVLDVLLPDGDGIGLLEEIRRDPIHAHAAVILLSTEAEVRDRVRGLERGADEYVGKPYESHDLVMRVGDLLRGTEGGPPQGGRMTVLVIDDSASVRAELARALAIAGYVVITAETGEEGLRAAVQARPDAVIVNGVLPGIDGETVLRRMKLDPALRRIPALMLTGSEETRIEVSALESGADGYAHKGANMSAVVARLGAMLRGVERPSGIAEAPSGLGPKRILAVDDSRTYLHELALQLKREGYDVVLASSGEEALDLMGMQPVDCVLLDLVMPGLSGHETCRRIRASRAWRHVPVIVLTVLEEDRALIQAMDAGADDFITKSSDFEVLRARVRAQLRRRQIEEENRLTRDQLLRQEREAAVAEAVRRLAEVRALLMADLERKNAELARANAGLEAFAHSLSHDLRAPARHIEAFSGEVLETCGEGLTQRGRQRLSWVNQAAKHMLETIDDMLELSSVEGAALVRETVDLGALARRTLRQLRESEPDRMVEFVVGGAVTADGDPRLLRIMLENLLANAWKFTSKHPRSRIELGRTATPSGAAYFVRDDGVGFDMTHAGKLFQTFQRLHGASEFEGTGIGLATVRRVVERHGGRAWAESEVDRGATIYFTLGGGA